jgi:glycosyltransferase involved in cell wall biosynthesis
MEPLPDAQTGKTVFTIVTPSYNQGQFIEQTIRSVLDQEGDFFIDYIIADGGSTDHSVEIIKKYDELLKKDLYLVKCKGITYRWWSHTDKGQAAALNQGFKLANGEIFAWINSDDFYTEGAFQKVAGAFQKEPTAAIVYGNGYTFFDSDGITIPVVTPKITYRRLLFRGCEIFQPSTFFTKKSFTEVGGIDETLSFAFDYDLWLKMLKRGKAFHSDAYLSSFRLWQQSKTATSSKKFIREEKIVLKRHTKFVGPYHFFMFKRALKKLFPSLKHTIA